MTDENSKLPETEDKTSITLVINKIVKYKKWPAIQMNLKIEYLFVKDYGYLPFAKNMSKNISTKTSKNLSGKYSQILRDHAKQSAIETVKITSKRVMTWDQYNSIIMEYQKKCKTIHQMNHLNLEQKIGV